MKIRHSILTATRFFAAILLFGDSDSNLLLSAEITDALDIEGRTSRFFAGNDGPTLAPAPNHLRIIIKDSENIRTNIGVEALFRKRVSIDDESMLAYANLLLAFSNLKGISYYSASRGTERLLFEESGTMRSREGET